MGHTERRPRLVITDMKKIVIAFYILLSVCVAQSASDIDNLAIVAAKIYTSPGAAPITDGVVLVKAGKITSVGEKSKVKIPADYKTIDGSGLVLTASYWNCHVHFSELKWQNAGNLTAAQLARQAQEMFTRYGFVHVFDTGSFTENTLIIKQRIERGEAPGPVIYTAGIPFVPPNGTPFYLSPLKLPELASPEEADRAVRARIDSGADAIKLFAASPVGMGRPPVVMPVPIAKAAAATAHALGKPVIAHPTNNAGINVVIESHIDILAHTTPDGQEIWSDELVKRIRAADVALIPTLKLWNWELARKNGSVELLAKFTGTAVEQLRAYSQAGGTILFGTDVGYMTDYDPAEEYQLMTKAGMSFAQILTALTTAPAKKFGLAKQTGAIAEGMEANLVLLAGDPATDITAFTKVRYTLRQGKIIYHNNLK